MLRLGSSGAAVAEVRARLAYLGYLNDASSATIDVFDEEVDRAVRTFQQERGLRVDGIVGPNTQRHLDEARWQLGDRILSFVPGHLMRGDDIGELQRRLMQLGFNAGRIDGIFGKDTYGALREFQRSVGVTADGTCGPDTFKAFDRLTRTVSGGDSTGIREHITLADLQSGIANKVIVIDPCSSTDAELCFTIARRVEGRLAALGTQVLLAATPDNNISDTERAAFANDMGADFVISLDVDRQSSALPEGIATFYYGHPRGSVHSVAGRILAEHVQREVLANTDRLDCGVHPRTWDLLRMTRMPAVRVELGYLSNPQDAKRLTSPAFHDAVAGAIAHAATAFCSPR